MSYSTSKNLNSIAHENKTLKKALAGLICWIGKSPEGPSWATPEAKKRNREMFEAAMRDAINCFPENYVGSGDEDGVPSAPNSFN